jgi:hypothetical protein
VIIGDSIVVMPFYEVLLRLKEQGTSHDATFYIVFPKKALSVRGFHSTHN